jgi:large subunit ribosomal protein L47
MAKIQTIISERKKVCEDYRKHLEEEYVAKQREKFEEKLAEEEKLKELEPKLPEITTNLLRAKYRDLRRGIDNTDYIKKAVEIETNRSNLNEYLDEKYDYKSKKIVKDQTTSEGTPENSVILGFKSGILEQLNSGRFKISQEEVLRSHIKNWKMLDFKQKRRVLGVINARRARDAKSEFLKELDLLGQKIAYDNLQEQKFKANA